MLKKYQFGGFFPPSTSGLNLNTNLSLPSSYQGPSVTYNNSFGSFTTNLLGGGTSIAQNSQGLTGMTFNPGYTKGSFGDPNLTLGSFNGNPGTSSFGGGTDSSDVNIVTGSKKTRGNLASKFQNITSDQWGKGIGIAASIGQNALNAIAGPKMGSNGPNAGITQGMDAMYNAASDAMMQVNPMVGGIMKAAGFAGDIINAAGGGTDGMTKVDSVLNSAPMTLLTLGLNGFLGSKSETMTKDSEAFDQVGSSYGGTGDLVEDALSKAGKKYGALSGGARDKANALIREAKAQQEIMSSIASSAKDSFALQSSMTNINNNRRANRLQGGYNQAAVRVGRQGLKIKRIVSAYNMSVKLQKGGTIKDPFKYYLQSLPLNLQDTTNYRMKDYWEYNGRPKDFKEAIQKGMFIQEKDGWHAYSVQENPATGEIEFMKSSSHPNHHMEVDWYNSDDGAEFRSQYELQKTEPYWKYVKRKPQGEAVGSYREGGILEISLSDIPEEYLEPISTIEEVTLDSILPEFKEGGKVNVIPEGALHARLHHMENAENLTKKGIPVVSEKENGQLEQQAEIERDEIIFRLEVTKKLEELLKKYSDNETSQKDKDLVAIEAGKLLVEEILNNTQDNTNLINNIN